MLENVIHAFVTITLKLKMKLAQIRITWKIWFRLPLCTKSPKKDEHLLGISEYLPSLSTDTPICTNDHIKNGANMIKIGIKKKLCNLPH